MLSFEPGYIRMYRSGELARRTENLTNRLAACDICPRKCGVNRLKGQEGYCHSGYSPLVAACCAHHGEEPPISGSKGSGTVFFSNCTLHCIYCQNYQISQDFKSQRHNQVSISTLAERMLSLQSEGCHNINLVTPTHFVPQIMQALLVAVPRGLYIPIVYNTSGYECLDVIEMLDNVIDIYLPDLRYASDTSAKALSKAPDYANYARTAIREMYRQVGDLQISEDGIAQRGLIVRHLILPVRLAGIHESLKWLAGEVSPSVTVSIMSQYYPANHAVNDKEINRKITPAEYDEVVELVNSLGLENGWLQEMESAGTYLPDFKQAGHPFEDKKRLNS